MFVIISTQQLNIQEMPSFLCVKPKFEVIAQNHVCYSWQLYLDLHLQEKGKILAADWLGTKNAAIPQTTQQPVWVG
jgi:hypothetical protein